MLYSLSKNPDGPLMIGQRCLNSCIDHRNVDECHASVRSDYFYLAFCEYLNWHTFSWLSNLTQIKEIQ
jgi:hypothetical protein